VVGDARRVTCRKSKGQVFFEWANHLDRNQGDVGLCDDVSILGSGKILQVQLLGELSRLLLVFFVGANRIDQGHGDVGCCDDVCILGSGA